MNIKQFTETPSKTTIIVLLVLVCVLLQCCFWNAPVYAEEPNTEITSRGIESPALPAGEMPGEFPQRGDSGNERQRPTDADQVSGNTHNRVPMQNEQQLNESSDYMTLVVSLTSLLLAFVFVKFYKRKNY